MSRWNLSTFSMCSLRAGDDPILPQGNWRGGCRNQMSIVALQAMALGDPSGWGGKGQQDQEPKITSTLTARASLTSLQAHAEPLNTSSPVLCTPHGVYTDPREVTGGSSHPKHMGRPTQGSLFSHLPSLCSEKDTNSRSCLCVGTAHISKHKLQVFWLWNLRSVNHFQALQENWTNGISTGLRKKL